MATVRLAQADQPHIDHFIPSVELTGSRQEQLATLDTLLAYLRDLRRTIAGDEPASLKNHPLTSEPRTERDGAWWILGATIVLLVMIFAAWMRVAAPLSLDGRPPVQIHAASATR
jgi:hypothetical protein